MVELIRVNESIATHPARSLHSVPLLHFRSCSCVGSVPRLDMLTNDVGHLVQVGDTVDTVALWDLRADNNMQINMHVR